MSCLEHWSIRKLLESSGSVLVPVDERSQMIFVGVDWAEAHHDVFVEDEEGKRLGGGRLPEGVDGIARFHDLVGGHLEDPAEVVVGIETDRGLFVAALVAAGYQVFAVNPMSTSRYRDRHSTSGAKSDLLTELPQLAAQLSA